MIIIIFPKLFSKRFNGLAVFPFVFLKHDDLKEDTVLLNHERIHLRQQVELLWLPFFIWYGVEYLIRLIQYKDRFLAYQNISFEKEAYAHETDLEYCKTRSFFGFLRFL